MVVLVVVEMVVKVEVEVVAVVGGGGGGGGGDRDRVRGEGEDDGGGSCGWWVVVVVVVVVIEVEISGSREYQEHELNYQRCQVHEMRMDYAESRIELEELEYCGWEQPPPYLVAEQTLGIEIVANQEQMKERMRKWAKEVASMNETLIFPPKSTSVFR
ncbi:unnamed protein product [Prunus armeniaca]|uniref:Uncharacterized protein n=1 Tax=Prunus armeniaca TaxID=36596 RepID=A0A6J5V494_PRUAR|nr:unnamed protein product [Prunus armeniaca]